MFGFKRSTPAPVAAPAPTAADLATEYAYASAWGYSLELWYGMLTERQRAERRDRVAYAPFVNAGN